VVVFNRPVSGYKLDDNGRLLAVTDKHLLIEANQRIRPVPFKDLDRLTVLQPKELPLSSGYRLQLKANANATDGRKVVNGELVAVKQVHPDGRIVLADGRTLDKSRRQFVRGYAVTSYAAQGKTVDYVLFSDSAVRAATNDQQWYVTISRGRKGVQIFTADKIQLRQNVVRSGGRELALDIAKESVVHALAKTWGRDIGYVFNVQHSQRQTAQRRAELLGQAEAAKMSEGEQHTETPKQSELVRQSPGVRTARRIIQSHQHNQGMEEASEYERFKNERIQRTPSVLPPEPPSDGQPRPSGQRAVGTDSHLFLFAPLSPLGSRQVRVGPR
jgi:hypothetical protein